MLELKNIKKDYQLKDQEPVHALKGISLKFRENEFVAILGHSGCGKTTLLNITGGLDHYDSGDLIIKGISTKDFNDNDWDTYRNHSVGFVFQSYNLIPHQTIIKNVELALTISGINKTEREERAKKVLDMVGLNGLYNKKPNQLSGGQMQRVAIARALVNDPEIVLADEPTGALDSETSVQIMDILKDVSKNHLVIMVTHNPELAEEYASRIVRMKDGEITSDSNPYDGAEATTKTETVNKGNKKQSSMSFLTATGLSVSNLLSKLKRTILVSIAGSIGIIGVSAILGVSCGVNNYIYDMQDDMLSSYPISIAEETMDMNSMLTGLSNQDKEKIAEFDTSTRVGLDSMIAYLMGKYADFTNFKTNDINQELVQYIGDMPKEYVSAITYDYGIDPTNNIFTQFKDKKEQAEYDMASMNGLTQRYIKTLMTVEGFSQYATYVDLFANFMKELPDEEQYIMSQYDMIAGSKFATEPNEIMLVVDQKTTLTDILLAQMGYYPQDEFLNIAKRAEELQTLLNDLNSGVISQQEYDERAAEIEKEYPYSTSFSFEEVLEHKLVYYPHDAIYSKDPTFVSHKQVNGNVSGLDSSGKRYILSLSYIPANDLISGTYIVLDSLNNIETNETVALQRMNDPSDTKNSVLEGTWGGMSLTTKKLIALNLKTSNPTIVDEKTIDFDIDPTSVLRDMSTGTTVSLSSGGIREVEPETSDFYYSAFAKDNEKIKDKPVSEIPDAMELEIVGILRAKSTTNFGTLSRGLYYTKSFANKYIQDAEKSEIFRAYNTHIEEQCFKQSSFNAYVSFMYDDYSKDPLVPTPKFGYSSALNGDFASSIASIFLSFLNNDDEAVNAEREHLRCISGRKIIETEDEVTHEAIYTTELLPSSISIYPKNFQQKDNVINYLDVWNKELDQHPDRTELTYTDTISMIVTVISTLVTTISIALIAFTSLSLVVSCFMIAVITYISVMERVKEIGVIRSLGGRKKDVTRLFTAENLITGFASGTFGILITYVIQIIINAIVSPFGVHNIAALPWYYALLMIGIAVLLSVLSGAIPSMSASKQDPVIALRTE